MFESGGEPAVEGGLAPGKVTGNQRAGAHRQREAERPHADVDPLLRNGVAPTIPVPGTRTRMGQPSSGVAPVATTVISIR